MDKTDLAYLIDAYFSNSLSVEENLAFTRRINVDPRFKARVDFSQRMARLPKSQVFSSPAIAVQPDFKTVLFNVAAELGLKKLHKPKLLKRLHPAVENGRYMTQLKYWRLVILLYLAFVGILIIFIYFYFVALNNLRP